MNISRHLYVAGGHRGGGGSGPSIGILETATSTSTRNGKTFSLGSAGPGGSSAGIPGAAGERVDFKRGT
ncbi:MAG: hypothetical protein PVJ64_11250 [Gemmatimonadales bacterium]|jgi:hypothetical protein